MLILTVSLIGETPQTCFLLSLFPFEYLFLFETCFLLSPVPFWVLFPLRNLFPFKTCSLWSSSLLSPVLPFGSCSLLSLVLSVVCFLLPVSSWDLFPLDWDLFPSKTCSFWTLSNYSRLIKFCFSRSPRIANSQVRWSGK